MEPEYHFPDDTALEARVKYFSDTMASLKIELGCARALLEKAMTEGKQRLSLDAIAVIQKLVREIQEEQIRAKDLFPREVVVKIANLYCQAVMDVLDAEYGNVEAGRIGDLIAAQWRETKTQCLLLEVSYDE